MKNHPMSAAATLPASRLKAAKEKRSSSRQDAREALAKTFEDLGIDDLPAEKFMRTLRKNGYNVARLPNLYKEV